MVRALFDTNILIDYLNGVDGAKEELTRHEAPAISVVGWIEVMAGAGPEVEAATRAFLDRFERIPVDEAIAERAVAIRRKRRLKLPDAIVWASALCRSMLLVTRDTKAFPAEEPSIRVPYP